MEHSLEYISEEVKELNEFMSKIYWGDHLAITTDIFEKGQPEDKTFFKVFRLGSKADFNTIEGVCRISIDKPEYIEGYDSDIRLTNEEIDEIIEALTKNDNYGWEYILFESNKIFECLGINKRYDDNNYKIPDYNLLKEIK